MDNAQDMTALQSATIAELIDERGRRSHAGLGAYSMDGRNEPDKETTLVQYRGGYMSAVGLSVRVYEELVGGLRGNP